MRHRKRVKKLGKKSNQRKALLKNQVSALILYEKIITTRARAKQVKGIAERLINHGKLHSLQSRRYLIKYLVNQNVVNKILEDLSKQFAEKKSGYIRTSEIGPRRGDAAPQVILELIMPHKEKEAKIQQEKIKTKISKTKIKVSKKPTISITEKQSWIDKAKGLGKIFKKKQPETKITTRRTTSK